MGLALFKERRITIRRRLTGLLPGRLVMADTYKDIACRPVDVSRNGMGIVLSEEIEPGTEVKLLLKDQPVAMHVAWVQRDFGKQDMFRYGLVLLDPSHDLEAEFIKAGCMV